MNKTVLYGKESRSKTLEGVRKLTDAVKVTMGAAGKCVLIGDAIYSDGWLFHLPNRITKDGWSVAKHFELTDAVENRGAMALKEAATKTVIEAGDATTATCVLAASLIENGVSLVDTGVNSQEVKKGMDIALEYIISELKKISIPVSGNNEMVRHIATVSANNDEVIGKLIADTFLKIGDEGVIDIEESQGTKTEVKITDGYKLSRGWLSQLFVTNRAKETCEFENPLILLYQNKVTHHTQIQLAVNIAIQAQKSLLIISEDCDEEGLAYLSINNQRKAISVCAIKSPFGEKRNEEMEDIALLTGATYISDIRGIDIAKDLELSHFGTAKKVVISRTETLIIGGAKDEGLFDDLIADLRMNLTQIKTEEEKKPIENRIARLTGSSAVIQVGAATETERNEKLDRVDDAVRATKAAISEGAIAGGGTAFLRIKNTIEDKKYSDRNAGIELVFKALREPFMQICINAGVDEKDLLQKVILESGNMGYNVLTGEIEDMVKSGILDSTKALRCALTNAVSVAGMILTSECSIITTS
jgi:chaperonin GroEL